MIATKCLFKVKHLGSIQNYPGVEMTQNENGCFELCQEGKIKLLEWYGMTNAKNISTPMTTGYVKETEDTVFEDKTMYQLLVGFLRYISCRS